LAFYGRQWVFNSALAPNQKQLIIKSNHMEKTYKSCQSCGMPMKKDPAGGGTNADGTKSLMYCCYCYQKGTFTRNCTMREMQDLCRGKLQEMGFPGFLALFFTLNLPRLKRWKDKK
jgi:hypothetical protein